MNPPDQNAEAVWQRTLPHIRSTRRRRGHRRITGAVGACGALAAVWLTLHAGKPIDKPVVVTESASPVLETIAVMRIDDNGAIRLEEVACNELGMTELTLGEAPLISDDLQYW